MKLTPADRDMAEGRAGPAAQKAMEIVIAHGEMTGAGRLIDVTSAHIDACLHHGLAGVEFAEMLRDLGARVAVPSTLNVSSLDLLHPDLFRGDPATAEEARRLMNAYVDMGCRPTWTCAPYQLPSRPGLGEHVAWAESNAIVFANSVLGARTGRYGDFFDIAAAITGRVPDEGLHRSENRRASEVFDVSGLPADVLGSEILNPILGLLMGEAARGIPAVVGLPGSTTEDGLKALGAAAASSGALGMFHAVGITPEAPDLATALGGNRAGRVTEVTGGMLRRTLDSLCTGEEGRLSAVSVGTPHFSLDEMRLTARLLGGRNVAESTRLFVSTGRDVYETARDEGITGTLEKAGATLVVDTCTYITPIIEDTTGLMMTNSAKWAYYAPANLGVSVTFGSLRDCVESAVAGEVVTDLGERGFA